MKMSDITRIIRDMKGKMPESSRFDLALKFVRQFGKDLTTAGHSGKLKVWVDQGGPSQFFKDCELESGPANTRHDIAVDDTALAVFINRWMNVEAFRQVGDEEFTPITPVMNSLRTTMIEELKGLADGVDITSSGHSEMEKPES